MAIEQELDTVADLLSEILSWEKAYEAELARLSIEEININALAHTLH